MPHGLDVFQSMWAMERRRPDGQEWPATEAVRMISESGFAGIDIIATEKYLKEKSPAFLAALRDTDLDITLTAFPGRSDRLDPTIELADKWRDRVRYINLIPRVLPVDVSECADFVRGWLEQGRNAGFAVYIETHRMSMTQDMLFTLGLMDAVPEMRLVADLSHYMVNQEWTFPPLTEAEEALVDRVLQRTEGFQGRVASAQQVQIQPDFPQHRVWVEIFREWWRRGFIDWRRRHASEPDRRLVFLTELGPPPYAITGSDGYELSDRWRDSLTMRRWVEEIWNGM